MNAFDSENKDSRKYPPLAVSCLTALGEFLGGEVVLNEDDCFNVAVEDENPVTIHLDAEQEKFELVGPNFSVNYTQKTENSLNP